MNQLTYLLSGCGLFANNTEKPKQKPDLLFVKLL